MAITLDGTSGVTTPGVVNTAAETIATTLAVTGVTTLQAGTAALPALTTTGDTNTGIFFPAADAISASTGGTERFRLDSSGNLAINATTASNKLEVNGSARFYTAANGDVSITHSGLVSSITAAGSISLALGTGNTERARFNTTGALVFAGGTTTADGIGITFPATQSASTNANTLDDYEEGTWSPTIEGSSVAGTATYSVRNGRYTKIGRMVQFECYVAYSSGSGSGNLKVTGLPFAAAGTTFPSVSCTTENLALAANNYACPYVQEGNTFVFMASNPTGGGSRNAIPYDAAAEIHIAGTYSI